MAHVLRTLHVVVICLGMGGSCRAEDLVPFVIPAQMHPDSVIALKGQVPIQTDSERVMVKDGHFFCGDKRVRIWGVNLSFVADFPTHEDAEKVAARLAAYGVNSVRCHHMDTSNWPSGIWDAQDPCQLSAEALDRLDYFIDQLARRGIYTNINLHVGREHSKTVGLPATEHGYDKIYNLFTPELVQAQKQYAEKLLSRVNPYRQVRYADDPAIAFVEITNENSFFMWDGDETLRALQPYYEALLRDRYNTWLRDRYPSHDALAQAWSSGITSLGQNVIRNGRFEAMGSTVPVNWNLEQHADARAVIEKQARGIQIRIVRRDETNWHLQFNQGGLSLEAGQYYTVIFEARADQPRTLYCNVGQAHDPWQILGLSREVNLDTEWRTYTLGFVAGQGDTNARLNFAFGNHDAAVYLDNVQLRTGGQVALSETESLEQGTVNLFMENESGPRQLDRLVFLAQTEKAFFDGMRTYIKNDLGCPALVTGTIVFGPLGLYAQSDMDFIDSHAYWQHPQFPGRAWDPGDWLIDQIPMVDVPQQATVFRLAAERLLGKPYTVSEYNHPAPLDSQAACVPMIASFAAAQDWDGIWIYTYSHSNTEWDRAYLNSFFDVDTNPAKWGFMRGAAVMFRDAGLPPLDFQATIGLTEPGQDLVYSLAAHHVRHGTDLFALQSDMYSMGRSNLLDVQLYATLVGIPVIKPVSTSGTELTWFVKDDQGVYACAGGGILVVTGHAPHVAIATEGAIVAQSPQEISLVIAALDGRPVQESRQLLVTACGRCENTGMVFSEDRRTVGRQWGRAPVRIEPVTATITLSDTDWSCWSLDAEGQRSQQVSVTQVNDRPVVQIGPAYETMWYMMER